MQGLLQGFDEAFVFFGVAGGDPEVGRVAEGGVIADDDALHQQIFADRLGAQAAVQEDGVGLGGDVFELITPAWVEPRGDGPPGSWLRFDDAGSHDIGRLVRI